MNKSSTVTETLTRIWSYLKAHRWIMVLAVASMALVAASEAGIPALLKPLLDKGFGAKDQAAQVKWLVPLAVVVLALVRGAAQYASNYLLSWLSNRVLLDLRLHMFQRMLHASAFFFQRETASTIMNAIVFEVNQVLSILTGVLITLVRDSLAVFFLLGYLFYLNWRLTLILAVILPIIGWLVGKINLRLRRLNREHQKLTNELSYIVEETIAGYKVVKVHHGEPYEMRRFAAMSARLRGYAMRLTVSGALAQPLTQFLASIALALVLAIAVMQAAADQTTIGGFVAFVTAMLLIISPLKHLIDINQPLQRGITAAELIFGLIDEPAEPAGGGRTLARAQGKVEFQQVSFSYGATHPPTLRDLSFTVAPGEVCALVGQSGSGKTTLINLLPRFFDPSAGQILIDETPLTAYQLADLRNQLAFVSQEVVLFNDSIAANVAYGQTIDRGRVEQALAAAHLMELIAELPDGMETQIGGNGMRLSGGQRQRLALARAIYKDAPILILDEATSALDAESESHVQAALDVLMHGRTTFVIAHRLATIERADRILVLEAGQIVEQGKHSELLRQNGRYAQLYRLQHESRQTI
ncbi:MAG: ATP-binding cassette, subfamily B, MsbA [Glomeribacter sp. 1016415]|uniref:Lipid a export ATP-binding/permease protein MSBAG n=1 Tax=Mycoavidus cysteinexigens TaxID=1553431 RepID=A0A2Z6EUG8_9BURK|nr:lipid A export permease/ATP-binding protein MsbA [Mycoavidus cysteinexigens]MCX8567373.1 ATP-binding cassette, subfamily B, MsbA [Glomeribacter sp. 1016415]BBE09090.1 lipid a export ATP-binding/permease protein MSBAG [Mycoavidus cysteinexigens]GAM52170.1 lipid A export ATP-binding/permease protein MsbA [bacterium endosymbiont of Mortierella elongata FMR23-6]GLR00245.1 lipid A export ATP-binding/permease protein MsbA [Mycoavidus cysteinexigens]